MKYKEDWTGGLNKRNRDYLSRKRNKSFELILKIEWNFVKCLRSAYHFMQREKSEEITWSLILLS